MFCNNFVICCKIKNINTPRMKDVMNEAFLGLGGNEGNRLENLNDSIRAIELECGKITMKSSIYETEAWGLQTEKKFLNQVIKLQTKLSAQKLLDKLLRIEQNLGRERSKHGYADRTVDIDILFMNEEILETEELQIPHPRLHLRKFILIPLNEIAADHIHPVLQTSISKLLEKCQDNLEAVIFDPS